VAALHVDADEEHAGGDPAQVLAVFPVTARLPLELEAAVGEARVAGFEELAKPAQAFHRIEAAAVAVHPFVVARNDHERVPEFLELAFPRLEPLVGAGA